MVRYCSYKVNYCLHRQDSGALVSASLERNVNPAADRKLQCHIPTDWLGRHIIVIHARVFDSKFFFFLRFLFWFFFLRCRVARCGCQTLILGGVNRTTPNVERQ